MHSMVAKTWSDWLSTGVSGLEDAGVSDLPATAGLLRSCGGAGDTTGACPWIVCGTTADFGSSPAGGGGGAREEVVGFLRGLVATFGFFRPRGQGGLYVDLSLRGGRPTRGAELRGGLNIALDGGPERRGGDR